MISTWNPRTTGSTNFTSSPFVSKYSALSGRGGSRDHSLVLRVCLLPFSLCRGRKKRGPGVRLRTLWRKRIQIRQWGYWKLGNGLFPKWPLPADEVRHLSQSTLNSPLLNEQKPVKHVVAFKAIPTSGHITLWSVVQMSDLPAGSVKGITRKGLILVNPWSPSIKLVLCRWHRIFLALVQLKDIEKLIEALSLIANNYYYVLSINQRPSENEIGVLRT